MAQDVEARFVADTSGFQAGMVQAATVTDAQMRRIVQYVQRATAANEAMERTAQRAAAGAKASYENVSRAAEGAARSHAGAQREVLVLAHELSQGNYKRFGGSLLVLGERLDILGKIATPVGAAVAGVAAAVLGAVVAMAAGAIEASKFSKALQLTGNFAAVTGDQISQMAALQKSLTGQTIGGARETLETVAGSGQFGPQTFGQVARAMGDYQRLTRANAEDAAKVFDTLAEDATAWSEKTNRAYHYLSLAQYDQIKALQDAGDKQGAAALAAKDLAEALESRGTPAVGLFARAWNGVTNAVSGAIEALKNVGRPEDTLVASLHAVDQQIALVRQANTGNPAAAADYLNALAAERARIVQQQFRETERASSVSLAAQEAQAGIEAQRYTEQVLKSAKALSARNDELKKFHDAVAAQAAAGKPLSPLDIKAGESEINKRYADHSQDTQENAYARLTEMVKAFNQTTQQEIERQGKLTEAQTFAIHAHEELEKAKRKLTAAQYASVSVSISDAAAQRQAAQFSLEAAKAAIEAVRASTANQEAQRALLTNLVQGGNDQANAIYRQMGLIGKNADDALKIRELQKFDDLVGKALLGADKSTTEEIMRVAAVIRGNLAESIDAAKKAQDDFNASFENGWSKASQDYAKQAADNAGAAEKVFQDAARGMEDAIVQFAMTGKLNFKSFVDSVIADLLRIEVHKELSSLFGGGSSGGASSSIGLIGAAGSALANSNVIGSALDIFPTFANGIDYVPYDGFPAILHEGERVARRQDAAVDRSSRGAVHIDLSGQTINAGQGVSRAEVFEAVRQGNQATVAQITRLVRTGKVVGA